MITREKNKTRTDNGPRLTRIKLKIQQQYKHANMLSEQLGRSFSINGTRCATHGQI